jgi:hypothetical protein
MAPELARLGEPGGDGAGIGIASQERAAWPAIWWCAVARADRQTARTGIGFSADRPPAKTHATPRRRQPVTIAARLVSTYITNIGPVPFSCLPWEGHLDPYRLLNCGNPSYRQGQ